MCYVWLAPVCGRGWMRGVKEGAVKHVGQCFDPRGALSSAASLVHMGTFAGSTALQAVRNSMCQDWGLWAGKKGHDTQHGLDSLGTVQGEMVVHVIRWTCV
jgi:hypothetical protein